MFLGYVMALLEANRRGLAGQLLELPRLGIPRGRHRKFVPCFGRGGGEVGREGVTAPLWGWRKDGREGFRLTSSRTKWVTRVSEVFLLKGDEFLESTIKERNVIFLKDFLSWNIKQCNKAQCRIFA